MLQSWRQSTKSQYFCYLPMWLSFIKNVSDPSVYDGIEFLNSLFAKRFSYQQICMARSAVSVLLQSDGRPFGKHPAVQRFMKGVFELRPVFPSYQFTWCLKTLFDYFRKLPHQKDLPFPLLGKKLAILIALLAGGQRCQTIHAINALHIRVLHDRCIIPIFRTLKQTRPGAHLKPLEFKVYTRESKLCVVDNLKEYLRKTMPIRCYPQLFLAMQKPHKPVSVDTISRWCRHMMGAGGIDVTKYSTHSCRAAAPSFAKHKGVRLQTIVDSAGWSSQKTFAKFFSKEISGESVIGESLLSP